VLQFDVGTCHGKPDAGSHRLDQGAFLDASRAFTSRIGPRARGKRKKKLPRPIRRRRFSFRGKKFSLQSKQSAAWEYYLMEQEGQPLPPEFETAQRCLDTWKTMAAGGA